MVTREAASRNFVPSANKYVVQNDVAIGKSFTCSNKGRGLSTLPCGTPDLRGRRSE